MDDDLVDESNLAHQRFTQSEIGLAKVDALATRFPKSASLTLSPGLRN